MEPSFSPLPEIIAYFARQTRVEKVRIPTLEDLPADLQEAIQELQERTGTWNPVEFYTADADCLQAERIRFLESFKEDKAYEPSFHYRTAEGTSMTGQREALDTLLHRAYSHRPETRVQAIARLMLAYKIQDDLATVDLVEGLQARNDALIARGLQRKYPGTDTRLLAIAEKSLEQLIHSEEHIPTLEPLLTEAERQKLQAQSFDAEGFKTAFEWALKQYGILRERPGDRGFRVEVDPNATAIDVRDKSRAGPTVFIPATTKGSAEQLLALMIHEIEGHARQSANGERLWLFGGGALKIDDETLYEGLAMRYEHEFRRTYFGNEESSPFPDFYVFAIARAEQGGSFRAVFEEQVRLMLHLSLKITLPEPLPGTTKIDPTLYDRTLRIAWQTTYRTMRGHVDMRNSASYAMAKDLAYLRGWVVDRELRSRGCGYVNEAAIASLGMLRILAEVELKETDLPYPHRHVTLEYMQLLLRKN